MSAPAAVLALVTYAEADHQLTDYDPVQATTDLLRDLRGLIDDIGGDFDGVLASIYDEAERHEQEAVLWV